MNCELQTFLLLTWIAFTETNMNITKTAVKYLVLSSKTDMGLGRDRNNKLGKGFSCAEFFRLIFLAVFLSFWLKFPAWCVLSFRKQCKGICGSHLSLRSKSLKTSHIDSAFEFSEGQLSNIYSFHLYTLAYTETIDSVEGAFRLANQTSNILFYSPPSNSREFCARKYCNSCRNKGVDIIFFSISSHCFDICQNNISTPCRWLAVDIYPAASRLGIINH